MSKNHQDNGEEDAEVGLLEMKSNEEIENENENSKKEEDTEEYEDAINPPDITYGRLFLLLLSFGFRAWGGPIAQISMIKQQLVEEEKWITLQRFKRVLAVYQALPGPEATELACYFGMVAKGRIGAILGGLGFILPGFFSMLLLSWIYVEYGLTSPYFKASFLSIQPCVTAMVFRAVHRIGEGAFANSKTKDFDNYLFLVGGLSALTSVMKINFFISLVFCGVLFVLLHRNKILFALILSAAGIAAYVLFAVFVGFSAIPIGTGLVGNRSLFGLFILGLLGGLLTFGGAYTAIPFVQQDVAKWMTNQEFLDGIALGSVVPAPLVVFVTFVGYVGARVPGAVLMTIGMFLPAFSFTLIGHNLFEKLVKIEVIGSFLDGITAAVVGLIAVTSFQLLKSAVSDVHGGVLFMLSLAAIYHFQHRYISIFVVIAGGIAGQVLYL